MKKSIGSCLRDYNWGNTSKDDIIAKYELVLESREIQLTDLSMELGKVQERLLKFEERNEVLESDYTILKKENEKLASVLKTKDFYLVQELNNKEHMFMRLQDKENECDELARQINLYKSEIKQLKSLITQYENNKSLSEFSYNSKFASEIIQKELSILDINQEQQSTNKMTIKSVNNSSSGINQVSSDQINVNVKPKEYQNEQIVKEDKINNEETVSNVKMSRVKFFNIG